MNLCFPSYICFIRQQALASRGVYSLATSYLSNNNGAYCPPLHVTRAQRAARHLNANLKNILSDIPR